MKIAILADIHANLPALEAVAGHVEAWQPDVVMVLGDVVNRGPRPAECLKFVLEQQRSRGWLLLRGNHEEYVLHHARHRLEGAEVELFRNSLWTYQQLRGQVKPLQAWPFALSLWPNGSELRVAHASMRHNRDGIYIETPDETLRQQLGKRPPAIFAVGHTHKPLLREVDATLVINAGAVGLPFDGDSRACYARVTHTAREWQAELVRLDYDRAQADRDFVHTGFLENGGDLARLIRSELRQARSHIAEWTAAYDASVRAGKISVAEAVALYLAEAGVTEA